MLKKISLYLIVAVVLLVISYPLFLRKQILWFVNNTEVGHFGVALLKKMHIYDHQAKVKNIRPEYVLALYQLMKDVHEVLEHTHITYWVDGGTLLGVMRHGGIIPWDDDLDIQIMEKDHQRFLDEALPLLKKMGYEFTASSNTVKMSPLQFKALGSENQPACDIFSAIEKEGKLDIGWQHGIAVQDLLPLTLRKFGEIQVWVHHNPMPYLEALYGKNWSKQAWRGVDHLSKTEGSVEGANSSIVPFHLDEPEMQPAKPTGPLKDNSGFLN